MGFRTILYFLSFTAIFTLNIFSAQANELTSGPVVNLAKYTGLWYEAARTPNDFEDNIVRKNGQEYGACYNATARYSIRKSDQINVQNKCLRKSKSGSVYKDTVKGLAIAEKDSRNRKLQIAFGSGVAQFFQRAISSGGFDYWIYCLGPVNSNGQYDWAVVSGAKKDFLFLLTRSKSVSKSKRAKMLNCAKKNGLPIQKLLYMQK